MTITRRALAMMTLMVAALAIAAPEAQATETTAFQVYFDVDSAARDPKTLAVVAEAAHYALDGRAIRVIITGHADAAEPNAAQLSLTRAKAIADSLVEQGIPAAILGVDGKGASEPAVRPAPGAAEPLNRRAAIDVVFR